MCPAPVSVHSRVTAVILFGCFLCLPLNATAIETDVCVYGGTSGGVLAAVQVARMGKRVVLIEPGRHLGGMTAAGLSAVDIGDPRSIGGITREYFTRLVASYGKELDWGIAFQNNGGPATGGAYSIEPHVAEALFDSMVEEAGVVVLRDTRMKSVRNEGARIVEIETENGHTVRAKIFIDTTYEGDLMAAAGVHFTLMREGNAKYGEHYNGIHYTDKYQPRTGHRQPKANGRVPGGQGVWDRDFPLDPYMVKGNPASGLLPLINDGEPGTDGEPAPGVMAYCFRLCLTTDKSNRIPITPPADYDRDRYELVARFIDACVANGDDMDLRWFSKHDPLPNSKWDFNTATFGGNLPGASWQWPEASYDRRAEIATEIENYHRGLLHFLTTDSRVPAKVRSEMKRFGLPKDEFTDNGGWPHQLYIREGRRMVSDLVLTEHHTFGRSTAPQSIGLGSYGTDVHEIRRIVKDGVVAREGKVAGGRGGFGPYNIGYGAIVPKQAECENLFVTFALSASHTAFASIRMEPVLMVTSQSAATAACLAIDADVPVQQVDYDRLRSRLVADGQVLEWTFDKGNASPRKITKAADLPGIAMDDTDAKFTGDWIQSSGQPSLIGLSYRHDGNTDRGQKSATFTPVIPHDGRYEVRLLYTSHANRSTKTKVTVRSVDGDQTVSVDQQQPALVDEVPRSLGTFQFQQGTSGQIVISNEGSDGYVAVDGIQLVPVETLWDPNVAVPSAAELLDIPGIEFSVVKQHEPETDKFDWLHGIALVWHGDRLFASFGHNHGKENTASEMANYCISSDGGASWSSVKLIDEGEEANHAVSHGVFLNHGGQLWAFHGAFNGRMRKIHTRAYLWDETTEVWTKQGTVMEEGFWPMQEPQPMADGNWLMAGLQVVEGIGKPNNPAAVAISHGNDLLKWDLVSIPKPADVNMWGESTVLVDGSDVVNVSRYQKPIALWSTSHDFGRTWTMMQESNLPMAASKPYAGVLSTGQRYLIGNTTSGNQNRRWPLTITVTAPNESQFCRTYRIRDAIHVGPGESHAKASLSYPYAVEHNGKLYVGYSNNGGRGANRNSAELAIIPVESLAPPSPND
ncbi:FAD-dependent oxidoreductase [Stieleria sp. TO1_6]|uniref:FAD-dependent oxidoreductase n=1 Tax=Stieleria tagensis TaxID=2956795 RepID=UPI00209AB70F|nr:FAD-dependent oxidoreductase [Stieleria tagensis]MCO8121261.1 FAD-dependent oxidoreductase [Stieleria tagensis]